MNRIDYIKNGDYFVPDLKLTPDEQTPLGKYGRMQKAYPKEHQSPLYTALCLKGKLESHCSEIDTRAQEQLDFLTVDLARSAGVTETLKAADPLGWAATMNALRAQAEEIIRHEIVLK